MSSSATPGGRGGGALTGGIPGGGPGGIIPEERFGGGPGGGPGDQTWMEGPKERKKTRMFHW